MNRPSSDGEEKIHKSIRSFSDWLEVAIRKHASVHEKAEDSFQPGDYPPGVLGALMEIRTDLENLFLANPKTLQFRPICSPTKKKVPPVPWWERTGDRIEEDEVALAAWANRERVEIFLRYVDRHIENSDSVRRGTFLAIRQKVVRTFPFLANITL